MKADQILSGHILEFKNDKIYILKLQKLKNSYQMATVSTTTILGSDSISSSRTTLNSNFLLLQNWINSYNNTFGIDSTNGILDLSLASTGRISAKSGKFDSIIVPSGGTALAQITSAGAASFQSLSTTTLTGSGAINLSGTLAQSGISTFTGNTNLNGAVNLNGALTIGYLAGSFRSKNTVVVTGATAGTPFSVSTSGGGGIATSSGSPYVITGLEDVIYAQCNPGFYMSVGTTGATASNIPDGLRITIVNTGASGGVIKTGIQGSSYTGFNTISAYGKFPSTGITVDANRPYQSSIQLQWEPRIGKGTGNQEGSWVVLGSSNMSWS
jgi:hypothetical protein